ncbi:pentatricopeptide repeat-containing protein At5g08510-like [Amaranthus tricolor]|uniref:pentatricopeptide repeat-containing protein At5g08510-like n=1 Tax=Amaranthus tricolor TaxID=29722 RepID=UPI00258E9304|nr:pentatricopeptide repeat-containing protein At5g08510-like [Amaranthus tricolor]
MTFLTLNTVAYPPISWFSQPPEQNPSFQYSNITFPIPKFKSIRNSLSSDQLVNNVSMDSTTYYASVLDSCASSILGKSLHAHALKSGFYGHEFVETKILQVYARCKCLYDARLMFDKMRKRNLHSWLAIISVYVEYDLFDDAFSVLLDLLYDDVRLDFFVFPVVLKICVGFQDVGFGRQIHGFVIKGMFILNVYVGNCLIDMYGKCGHLGDAKKVFCSMVERDSVSWNSLLSACALNGMVNEAFENLDKMSRSEDSIPNVISWSAVINGFAQNGYANEAIELLMRMQAVGVEPNAQTITGLLPAFAKLQTRKLAKGIHAYITRHGFMINPIVVNGLIDVYRRCNDTESAWRLFLRFAVKNLVSFNTIIVGFCENGDISKAKDLLNQSEIHGVKRDITTWNAMLSGYVDKLLFEEALNLFKEMQMVEGIEVDSYTLGSALSACSSRDSLRQGKEVHCQAIIKGLSSNPFVAEALMEMYFKTHDLNAAQKAFEEVIDRDINTWNTLISGYAWCNQMDVLPIFLERMRRDDCEPNIYTWNGIISGHIENGHYEVALQLLLEMQSTKLKPDAYTLGLILPACSRLATIERGKQVHGYSVRCGYDSDVYIGAALVDMYSKCGSINGAIRTNRRISKPNLISQNAMLTAYAMHGLGEEGISLFYTILSNGFAPDEVTFLSVLSACVHAGKVEIGHKIFNSMDYYNVKPSLKHYTCMIDLLSRSGKTTEAFELIRKMPMEPDSVTWGALLGGCAVSGDVKLGEMAAKKLLELEPNNTANFVLLANMYALAGRWNDLSRIRKIITERRMRKSAGCSWVEDGNDVHVFTVSDTSHRRTEEIYTMLMNLTTQMKTWMYIAVL